MIRSFKSKALKRFWSENNSSGIRNDHVEKIELILGALNRAAKPGDLNRPSFGFHALKGNMAGRYAVKVNANWRTTFGWDDNGPAAIDTDYEDYH